MASFLALSPLQRLSIFLLSLCVVLWFTLTPGSDTDQLFPHIDKLQHFTAFLGLGLLGCHAFPRHRHVMLFFLLLLGTGIELGQLYVPGRSASYGDALADGVGALVGSAIYPRAIECWRRWRNS